MQAGGTIKIALESADGSATYASTLFDSVSAEWEQYEATLAVSPASTDYNARLTISFSGPGALTVDVVSLLPEDNARKGALNPWPFREDLLQRLRDLEPRRVQALWLAVVNIITTFADH